MHACQKLLDGMECCLIWLIVIAAIIGKAMLTGIYLQVTPIPGSHNRIAEVLHLIQGEVRVVRAMQNDHWR